MLVFIGALIVTEALGYVAVRNSRWPELPASAHIIFVVLSALLALLVAFEVSGSIQQP